MSILGHLSPAYTAPTRCPPPPTILPCIRSQCHPSTLSLSHSPADQVSIRGWVDGWLDGCRVKRLVIGRVGRSFNACKAGWQTVLRAEERQGGKEGLEVLKHPFVPHWGICVVVGWGTSQRVHTAFELSFPHYWQHGPCQPKSCHFQQTVTVSLSKLFKKPFFFAIRCRSSVVHAPSGVCGLPTAHFYWLSLQIVLGEIFINFSTPFFSDNK